MSIGTAIAIGGSALASLAGGLFSNSANSNLNYRNRKWQEEMWNKQNEYNSPSAVLARYADAGIQVNPNYLVTGNYDGGLASHVGSPEQFAMKNPMEGVDFARAFTEVQRLDNETRVADSTVDTNTASAEKSRSEAKLNAENEQKIWWENYLTSETYEQTIDMAKEALEIKKNEHKISDKQYEIEMQKLEEAKEKVREARARADVEEEKVNTQKEQTISEQVNQVLMKAQTDYYSSSAQAQRAGAKMSLAQARYYDELTKNQSAVREEIRAHIKEYTAAAAKLFSDMGVNKELANKYAKEATQLVANGKVDRACKLLEAKLSITARRYQGIGSVVNPFLDLFMHVGDRVYRKGYGHGDDSEW